MQRTLILVLLLSAWGMPTHSASGSLSDSFAKTALQSLQAVETDILPTRTAVLPWVPVFGWS